jgi:hypothetical protein
MNKIHIAITMALSAPAGCAHSTDEIPTQYISPLVYEDYDCRQIGGEIERVNRRVNQLAGSIDKNAQGDAVAMGVGLILFWPALFFIDGDSPEAHEYGRLKGEYEALEKVSIKKNCGYEFPEITPRPAEDPDTAGQRSGPFYQSRAGQRPLDGANT